MKKLFILFAILVATCSFVANATENIARDQVKDSVSITIANATFKIDTIYTNSFNFYGLTADSSYTMNVSVNSTVFETGTYAESTFRKVATYLYNKKGYVYMSNLLGDAIATIDSSTGVTYYNLRMDLVGDDTILYKIDITYHIPYEKNYHEAVTTAANARDGWGLIKLTFTDSLYKYELSEAATYLKEPSNTVAWNDSLWFNVYDINDTKQYPTVIYSGYRGSFSYTKIDDTTYTIVGTILCVGDMKFYINCKRPTPTAINYVEQPTHQVCTGKNAIVLKGAEGKYADIYTINGRFVGSTYVNSDYQRIKMGNGLYVVRVNGIATKVFVK